MYCSSCGIKAQPEAVFCSACGNSLHAPTSQAFSTASTTSFVAAEQASYAGFWKRFVALFIDNIILSIGTLIVGFALALLGALTFPLAYASSGMDINATLLGEMFVFVFSVNYLVVGWLYYAILESSSKQATWGKRAVGIIVTDLEGGRIGFGRATGRYFGKMLSHIIMNIGFLMAAFTGKKQALHDMVASCLVVNKQQ